MFLSIHSNLRYCWTLGHHRRLCLAVLLTAVTVACGGSPEGGQQQTAATPTAAASPAPSSVSAEGEWFVKTGCAKCHAVSVYGVKSEAQIGPDLSMAVEDVKTRFGVPIEEFLENPSGTMALVLSSQIQLTPEQKKVAIAKLHAAYAAHQKTTGSAPATD
jgi:hypothetical protein